MGLCECGCGGETPIAKKTDARRGWKKGEHVRFISGHFGRMKLSAAQPTEVQRWTGDELTERDMLNLRDADDDFAAEVYTRRAMQIEKATRHTFVELGAICIEVRDRMLWRKIAHPETAELLHSWEAWVMLCLGVSRSSAYSAVAAIEALCPQVPMEQLRDMPRRNILQLMKVSNAVKRDPEILSTAQNGSEKDLVEAVQEKYPEQHLKVSSRIVMDLEPNDVEAFDEMVQAAAWAYEVDGYRDVMPNIIACFMDSPCEREGYSHLTNRDAWVLQKETM